MKPATHKPRRSDFRSIGNAHLIFLLFTVGFAQGQYSEFKVHDNGLIYSAQALGKLRHIVDSLNLKFKVCDASSKFISVGQCRANFIRLEGKRAREAKSDIDAGISYTEFKSKHPRAVYDEQILVVKGDNHSSERPLYWINSLRLGNSQERRLNSDEVKSIEPFLGPVKGKWIAYHHEQIGNWPEALEAFYFPEEFATRQIPGKYAMQIQYADCLIDTTAQIFSETASEMQRFVTKQSKAMQFTDYIYQIIKRPDFPRTDFAAYFNDTTLLAIDEMVLDTVLASEKQPTRKEKRKSRRQAKKQIAADRKQIEESMKRFEQEMEDRIANPEFVAYQEKLKEYEQTRLSRIDSLKNSDRYFVPMLKQAYDEALVCGGSFDDFEELVGIYLSKEDELKLKRNRRVVGGCSQDQSPRYHALNIALLAAETTKWEIFLRSHLDIMNDRFDRVSDGSYAWAARETYVKELETLGINVPDLIFGISLRVENAAPNHYFSSIGRTGRALSESRDAKFFEDRMLEMIADNALDDYNRLMMYFLFDNYNHYLKDASAQAENSRRLKTAVSRMPDYLSSRINQ